jgi:hypothetical protein
MKISALLIGVLAMMGFFAPTTLIHEPQAAASAAAVQVHMVITDQSFDDAEVPVLQPGNVQVKQGKTSLKVTQVIPAKGSNAALQLFILIDDTTDTSIGNKFDEIREFINAQPATTVIGVAYMSNATFQIAQDLTADHAAAAKALRLPRGRGSAMDSPYLSLIDLAKSWKQSNVRREVLMISDGIDRLRNERTTSGQTDMRGGIQSAGRPGISQFAYMSPDTDSASTACQRYGVIVHSIYATGAGRHGRNAWDAQVGQSGIGKIADETGGEYFALGTGNAVSFKPYLDRLQKIFDNQYFLVFQAVPKKNAGLQRVNISTELANVDLGSADNAWVPAAK